MKSYRVSYRTRKIGRNTTVSVIVEAGNRGKAQIQAKKEMRDDGIDPEKFFLLRLEQLKDDEWFTLFSG